MRACVRACVCACERVSFPRCGSSATRKFVLSVVPCVRVCVRTRCFFPLWFVCHEEVCASASVSLCERASILANLFRSISNGSGTLHGLKSFRDAVSLRWCCCFAAAAASAAVFVCFVSGARDKYIISNYPFSPRYSRWGGGSFYSTPLGLHSRLGGQTTLKLSSLSPKRDCSPKKVKHHFHTSDR